MSRLRANSTAWILVLSVALGTRLATAVWWQSRMPAEQKFFFGDSDGYWQLGSAIANGQPYQYQTPEARVLRTPGYPLLLSAVFLLFGDDPPILAARVASALCGTLAVAAAGWWGTLLFDARSGLLAGAIAAIYPGAVATSAMVLTEAPFAPWMVAHLALWTLAWRSASWRAMLMYAAAGGIAAGGATLIRPSWLLFVPFAIAALVVCDRRRARSLALGAAMCAGLAACMLPWWIRNARVTGHFVPTTLQMGASLYDGWRPTADGASDMRFVPEFVQAQRDADRAAGASDDGFEWRLDRRMREAAIAWAIAHPRRVVELAGTKFLRMWNVWPNEPSLRAWPVRLTIAATYVPLVALGLVGAWRFGRRGWPYVLAWLPAVYFSLLHMVFVSSIRYREPAMLGLIVLAAGVLSASASSSVARKPASEAS